MTKMKKAARYFAVAVFFFVAGMIFAPSGTLVRKVQKKLTYNTKTSQRLYDKWDKSSLFFSESGESFSDFAERNETFLIYFWATWCPHCRNINGEMNALKDARISLVGLSFDTVQDEYNSYLAENPVFWRDLFQKDEEEMLTFCKRVDELNIPSIPSVWVVSGGKVKKIFVGETGAKKLPSFLKKNGWLP